MITKNVTAELISTLFYVFYNLLQSFLNKEPCTESSWTGSFGEMYKLRTQEREGKYKVIRASIVASFIDLARRSPDGRF